MELTDETFLIYAAKHYDNPQCSSYEEFEEDLKRIQYLKRLFNRYEENGDLKERLIINHLIVLYNVFGNEATKLLFFKLEGYYHILKPFILLLGRLPDKVNGIGIENKTIHTSDIVMDEKIVEILRNI